MNLAQVTELSAGRLAPAESWPLDSDDLMISLCHCTGSASLWLLLVLRVGRGRFPRVPSGAVKLPNYLMTRVNGPLFARLWKASEVGSNLAWGSCVL